MTRDLMARPIPLLTCVVATLLTLCMAVSAGATQVDRHAVTAQTGARALAAQTPRAAQAGAAPPAGRAAQATPVTVTIDQVAPGPAVPPRFLGLSFEVAALNQLAQYAHRGDLVALLRSLGPGMLRFGGITADENVGWTDAATPRPAWASSAIGPADMKALGELAKRSDWQVLLTVGLAHYEPRSAAREVAAAHRALGPYLAAVEIGNEPDAYGRHGFRELPWIAQGYEEEVGAYREAIAALTPGVPIAGPDVSGSGVFPEWGEEEAYSQAPAFLTGHHYPLGCAQTPPPSIEALLSPVVRNREALSLATYLTVAKARDIPLRIDEANTVSCGGVAGISDTFASALWATSYITQSMAAGAAGINLEGNPTHCSGYTPLCAPDPGAVARGGLRAQPEWYALLLTRSLVGERPVPATISTGAGSAPAEPAPSPEEASQSTPNSQPATGGPSGASAPNLVAGAFAGPKGSVQIVLVDDEPLGAGPMSLRLTGLSSGRSDAKVLRLTAPAPNATGGVALAGDQVTVGGAWGPRSRPPSLPVNAGALALDLAPNSAALVTVSPRPAARRTRAARPRCAARAARRRRSARRSAC
jgi:hypothetical protein